MFKKSGLLGGIWKPKNPHSLEHLKYLYSVLYKNQTVTENNKGLLVETLRSIAEILIWGDQNDSSVFDFFLERNMLSFFLKIMNQKCGSYVCVQLLQTLNILFENIRNETSIYYLLSNNHVNSIIVHKFDFSDEEVMAYYISFLKTLSFRLNKHTIHFFYNEHTNDFPLYTEAIKFFNHSESMVRIAVRTLTLNVYRVDEESMLQFVIDKTAVPYFSNLVWFIGNHILEIDACVKNDVDHQSLGRLKDLVAEHLDHLHYLNDILCLQIDNLNKVLTDHLLTRLLIPLYIYSLVRRSNTNSIEDMKPHVSRVTALFLLCHIFLILTHVPLVRLLAWIIFVGNKDIFTERGAARLSDYTLYSLEADNFGSPNNTIESLGTLTEAGVNRIKKPSFAAPSQPLEKLLQEQMQMAIDDEAKKQLPRDQKPTKRSKSRSPAQDDARGVEKRPNKGEDQREGASTSNVDSKTINEKERMIYGNDAATCQEPQHKEGNNEKVTPLERQTKDRSEEYGEEFSLSGRPFLAAVFDALNCSENDYLPLFALCLLYAIQDNTGMSAALLKSVGIPCGKSDSKEWYNVQLVEKLLQILYSSCQYGSRIRLITLDVAVGVIKQLVINEERSFLADNHFAEIEGIKEESTLLLRNFYKSEEIFLDMFEDEYRESIKSMKKIEVVLSDASLLLPPTGTPLTGIDFTKRLPCGEVERARKAIRTFFRLRQLSLDVQGLEETFLPLSSPDSCVQVHDVLDLNNSDLLAVNVISTANSAITIGHDGGNSKLPKHRLFLVVDIYQIVLVEPDTKRLGWGVAIFAGFLQDLEVVSDKEDSRCLHVTVHGPKNALRTGRPAFSSPSSSPMGGGARRRANNKSSPLLSATFTFDDHIRCMAAKQRLTKGRAKARQRKMHQIAQLLDLPGNVGPSCPSPPALDLHSLRKEAAAHRKSRTRNASGGRSSNTSSPRHAVQHFGGMSLANQQTQAATKSAGRSVLSRIPSTLGFSSRPSVSTFQEDSEGTSSRSSGSIRQQAVSKLSSGTDHLDSRGLGRTGGSSPAICRTGSSSFKRVPSSNEEMEIGAIAMTDYSSSPKSEGIVGAQTKSLDDRMVTDSRDEAHFSEERHSIRENPFNSKDKL